MCCGGGSTDAKTVHIEFMSKVVGFVEGAPEVEQAVLSGEGAATGKREEGTPCWGWGWWSACHETGHCSVGAEWATHTGNACRVVPEELVRFRVAEFKYEVGGCPVQVSRGGMVPRVEEVWCWGSEFTDPE